MKTGFAAGLALVVAVRAWGVPVVSGGGVIAFEAENADGRVAGAVSHSWETLDLIPGFSGIGYTDTSIDDGTNISSNWTNTSPELQYSVNFPFTGTWYVWIRGYGPGANGDSIHAGLLGGPTNTAAAITLATTGQWQWTNTRMFGQGAGTITIGSTGVKTFGLWMREDGFKADRVVLTTNAAFQATLGNAWHIPSGAEPGITSMRSAGEPVTIYSGNQDLGPDGNPGNQTQTNSVVFYRNATNETWSVAPLTFFSAAGNNKYYSAPLPAFQPGDVVQYYLRIWYTDHLPTYLFGNDNASFTTELESVARGDAFAFTVPPALTPTGDYLAITNLATGAEGRIYTNSGHVALGAVVAFQPPAVKVGGETHYIGRVLSATPIAGGLELVQQLATTSVVARLTFLVDGVLRYEVVDWDGLPVTETSLAAASDASERFYGFGEKFNEFDQSGKKTRIITDDPPGTKGDKSYKVAPWFISTKGYGFHLDSSAESWFDLRASWSDRYVVSNQFPSLKFNVVAGPKLTDVLTRYTSYTGRPAMSPPWAFAPWMSTDIWRDGGEIRYLVTKYRERGLPGSVIVFDSPWQRGYNDFIWNTNQFAAGGTYESQFWPGFATIGEMLNFIGTNGFKVVCWMTPFINNAGTTGEVPGQQAVAANYAEALASNYFVRVVNAGVTNVLSASWWKGTGSPVDFTNPAATLWLQNQLSNLVAQSGGVIGGFKTDDGESGNPPGSYIPKNALYFDGRTGAEMQNGYSAEYHKAIWPVLGTNGILFARSGFTGSHAYPGYWSGDNEPNFGADNGLQSVIVASQSAAMSGYSTWSSDIGGYQNSNVSSTPENLFMRWTQFGAFSPLMQMHRQVGANNQYPWSYGAAALDNYRYYARLHTALFPYIYTYAKEASLTGLPIMRPLVLMHPEDVNTHGIKHTYLFGNELLVAAIITNVATSRTVYLPAGTWYDYFTQQKHTGGQNINWVNADQSQMPLFVREGAIVPLISSNTTSLVSVPNELEFLVYPATNSSFTVYDGTSLQCQSNGTVTAFTISATARPMQIRSFGAAPAGVERNGVPLPKFTDPATFAAASLGWWHSAGFTRIKFNHPGGVLPVKFGPDSVGDGITDSWRDTFFGSGPTTNALSCASCDGDGDGLTNDQEYTAGTNPTDPNSVLRITSITSQVVESKSNVVISWPSSEGITYRVQWKNDMADLWQTVAGSLSGTGSQLNWFDDGSATGNLPENSPTGRRFYRVITP